MKPIFDIINGPSQNEKELYQHQSAQHYQESVGNIVYTTYICFSDSESEKLYEVHVSYFK